jgi:hypothetical protein
MPKPAGTQELRFKIIFEIPKVVSSKCQTLGEGSVTITFTS